MCTTTNKEPLIKIAKKDIIVYKFVRRKTPTRLLKLFYPNSQWVGSMNNDFIYRIGKRYTTKLDKFEYLYIDRVYISKRGFYSWPSKHPESNVECIIPAGSKYILCKDIDTGRFIYHSDHIKITKIL